MADKTPSEQTTQKKEGLFQSTLKKLRPQVEKNDGTVTEVKITEDELKQNEEARALMTQEVVVEKTKEEKAKEIEAKKAKFAESLKRKSASQSAFESEIDSKKVKVSVEPLANKAVILPVHNSINSPALSIAPNNLEEVIAHVDNFVHSQGFTKATYQIQEYIERLGAEVEVQNPSPELKQQVRFNITFKKETGLYPFEGYLRVSR